MKAHRLLAMVLAVSCLGVGALAAAATVDVTTERLVPADRLRDIVDVRDVRMNDDGTVSGVVVNKSAHPVKDVELVVKYMWLWNREMRPGADPPGRAVFVTVPQEIPPGGQVSFTYRPDSPLTERADGRFVPRVDVAAVTEITQGVADSGQTAPPPATSRVRPEGGTMGDEPAAIR